MTCADVRELLLTADLETLQAPDGAFAVHLHSCARCRSAAERVVEAHAGLAASLAPSPALPAHVAARRAMADGRALGRRQRHVRRVLPAFLAAAAAAVVLLRPGGALPEGTVPLTTSEPALPPLVEGGAERVAVFTTGRPDITVIWQF